MRTFICSFLSILSLHIVELKALPEILSSIAIQRSPSESRDMDDFFQHVEERVTTAEREKPQALFCIDYNTIFLRLFERLDGSSPVEREKWLTGFLGHAKRLAHNHNVRGVKLFYRDLVDLPIASCIIKPFVDEQKLESLGLTPFRGQLGEQ